MNKKINIKWIFVWLLWPLGLSNIHAQSLVSLLELAAENNPGLKASYAEFEASMQKVSQANALPDPTLSFGYFISPVETRVGAQRARISISQLFPWFGTLQAKEEATTLMAESNYQRFLSAQADLFLQVKRAYYPLVELQQQIRLQQENMKFLTSYQELTTTSFSNGKGALADVVRVEIMMEELTTELQLLEEKRTPLLVKFNRLLNRPDSTEVVIPDSLELPEELFFTQDSISSHPQLQAMDLQANASAAMVEVAHKGNKPKFGIGLDYVIVSQRTDMDMPDNGKDIFMPMVSMSLPVFGKKNRAAVKEAEFMQSSMEYKREDMFNMLSMTYQQANYDLYKAKEQVELLERIIKKNDQLLSLQISAYSNSGKDFTEVLRTQQQVINYQLKIATATKEYHLALAQLEYLTQ